jgi:hypothetical protein
LKYLKIIVLLIIGVFFLASHVYAEKADTNEYKDQSREKKRFRNYSGEGSNSVSSFCIEGHIFVLVSSDTSNYLSIVQVYEEKNGKVVPKKCN